MEGRPRRSVLYMPGSNERALEKARSLPADALIFDLEDAVAPDAKPLAREKVCGAVKSGPCNEVFSPTEEEVDWSRKIIAAFRQPENAKKGVIVVEGRMVERLHLGMAERTVYIAESIREMESACA